jgi:hypothetical protein
LQLISKFYSSKHSSKYSFKITNIFLPCVRLHIRINYRQKKNDDEKEYAERNGTFQPERIGVSCGGHEAHADQLGEMEHQEVGPTPAQAHLLHQLLGNKTDYD